MPHSQTTWLSFLSVTLLLTFAALRFALIPTFPLFGDEAVYAEITEEMLRSPGLIPTYLGNPVSWKPPVSFWAYAPVLFTVRALFPGMPLEVAHRIAPAVFAVLSTLALFHLARELFSERHALIAALIFTSMNQTLATTNLLTLEGPLLFFMLLAMHAYVKGAGSRAWALAALFSSAAALTKTFSSLLIPVFAFVHYAWNRKRELHEPGFLLSLLAAPVALALYALVFFALVPYGTDIIVSYYDLAMRFSGYGIAHFLAGNFTDVFHSMFPWSALALASLPLLDLRKPRNVTLAAWLLLAAVPLLSFRGYFWYYLLLAPPVALLCAMALVRLDGWRAHAALAIGIALSLSIYSSFVQQPAGAADQKEAGIFLRGKEVLSLTESGMPGVFLYKFSEGPPDYSSTEQMVADPFGIESYTASPSLSDLIFGPNELANASARSLGKLIAASGKDYILLDARHYELYATAPLPEYSLAFVSSGRELYVLERVRSS